ncbi:hypothetical protein [Nonomuraea sp. NPDC001023]|uniref:hypothetical protein n=1 Tax=unclassified Nonomuraea TaxID=2593643 RepID=UPI003317657C
MREREGARKAEIDQLHVQQQIAEALRGFLTRTANEGLPVITWIIAGSPSEAPLTAICDIGDADKRRRDFEVWCDAFVAAKLPDEVNSQGGTRLRARVVDDYLNLPIDLIADV